MILGKRQGSLADYGNIPDQDQLEQDENEANMGTSQTGNKFYAEKRCNTIA